MSGFAETVRTAHEQAWTDFDQNSAQEAAENPNPPERKDATSAPRDSKPNKTRKKRDGNAGSKEEALLQTATAKIRKAESDLQKKIEQAKEDLESFDADGRLKAAEKGIGELFQSKSKIETAQTKLALDISALRESTSDALQLFEEQLNQDDKGQAEALVLLRTGMDDACNRMDRILEKQEGIDERIGEIEELLLGFQDVPKFVEELANLQNRLSDLEATLEKEMNIIKKEKLPAAMMAMKQQLQEEFDEKLADFIEKHELNQQLVDDDTTAALKKLNEAVFGGERGELNPDLVLFHTT